MIHVFIERHIADGMISTYQDCSTQALKQTYQQAGFISAEAYSDVDNPNHKFVVSQWRSKHDWAQWAKSQERLDFLNKISPMLSQPESVSINALES